MLVSGVIEKKGRIVLEKDEWVNWRKAFKVCGVNRTGTGCVYYLLFFFYSMEKWVRTVSTQSRNINEFKYKKKREEKKRKAQNNLWKIGVAMEKNKTRKEQFL